MKMKKYIAAGIMAAALLASGCGKFIREELILMQNEIDLLYTQIEDMNNGMTSLRGIVNQMASNGYIVDVKEFMDGDKGGYTLVFRSVKVDDNGNITTDDSYSIKLYSGVDGKDGKDAEPFVMTAKKDGDRWYWYDEQNQKWLRSESGDRFLVDGKDGQTPKLDIDKNGNWMISWNDGATWKTTEWKARGDNAQEVFSDAKVYDDRVEVTLASDGTVLKLLRYLPVEMSLAVGGKELTDSLLIAPGETVPITYTLKGTDVSQALVVAGTDGRLKTAIKSESDTLGTVNVTCPETFPEGGYIYITLNDGNGRSAVRIVHFFLRNIEITYGETEYAAKPAGETGVKVTFKTNTELVATCVFPEGVEPWITAKVESADNFVSLSYDVKANTSGKTRTAVIVVTPKDNPGFEAARITVTQKEG